MSEYKSLIDCGDLLINNCTIWRITIGSLPQDGNKLKAQLLDLATSSGESDPYDALYYWLEDKDNVAYIDGPKYSSDMVLQAGDTRAYFSELLSSGASKKVIGIQTIEEPADSLLCYSERIGNGELPNIPICGNEDETLISFTRPQSKEDLLAHAAKIQILTRVWETPIYSFEMFVGLSYNSEDLLDWQDNWGDGSYSSWDDETDANIMKPRKDAPPEECQWEYIDSDALTSLVEQICDKLRTCS